MLATADDSIDTKEASTPYGLLRRRAKMFRHAVTLGDRLSIIKQDIAALDEMIAMSGYRGDLEAAMPRRQRAGCPGCTGRCFAMP